MNGKPQTLNLKDLGLLSCEDLLIGLLNENIRSLSIFHNVPQSWIQIQRQKASTKHTKTSESNGLKRRQMRQSCSCANDDHDMPWSCTKITYKKILFCFHPCCNAWISVLLLIAPKSNFTPRKLKPLMRPTMLQEGVTKTWEGEKYDHWKVDIYL